MKVKTEVKHVILSNQDKICFAIDKNEGSRLAWSNLLIGQIVTRTCVRERAYGWNEYWHQRERSRSSHHKVTKSRYSL